MASIDYLEMKDITKYFGKVLAVSKGNLRLVKGEIHALMGENGAGKSTLMNVLSGSIRPTGGDIFIEGEKVIIDSPHTAKEIGIAKIHQELQLVPEMTAAENIFLGREPLKKNKLVDYPKMNRQAEQLFKEIELHVNPKNQVKNLRVGEQQLLEIMKAVSLKAKILIMDEPTSALSKNESERLFTVIRRLAGEGVTIIYITHRMEEVFELTDRITVMRDGEYIDTVYTKETNKDEIVRMMVGRVIDDFHDIENLSSNAEVLRMSNMSLDMNDSIFKRSLKDISFSLKKGEVLGIAGLMGAGRTELMECIFGMHPTRTTGDIYINQKHVKIRCPKDAIDNGIAFVTEDRKRQGLVLGRSIGENISLPILKRFSKFLFMKTRKEKVEWDKMINRLQIKAPSCYELCGNLSGGNQQKVVLARWLATNPKILLLDEPTRGIDVGAKGEIYELIHKLTEQGISIIVISSELPEVIRVSNRIITFCEGSMTGEFSREEVTQEKLLRAATKREAI